MYAGIMGGMQAQRKENLTNRRESSRLFNEHLKNAKELGIDLTEEGLSDFWGSISSGVNRRHAPTQERLKGIVDAQRKTISDANSLDSFQRMTNERQMDQWVTESMNEAFSRNIIPEDGNFSAIYDEVVGGFGDNQALIDIFNNKTASGQNIKNYHTTYNNGKMEVISTQIESLVKKGVTDLEELAAIFPSTPKHLIKLMVDKEILALDDEDVTRQQNLKKFENSQTTFENSQVVFDQGQVMFDKKLVRFDMETDRLINEQARLLVENGYADTEFERGTVEWKMKIEAAKEAITRKLIEEKQDDIVFGEDRTQFNFDMKAAVTSAARDVVEQEQADAALVRTRRTEDATTVDNAIGYIDGLIQSGNATPDNIREVLNRRGITDKDTVSEILQTSKLKYEQHVQGGMTKYNTSRDSKLVQLLNKNRETVDAAKTSTNKDLLNHFGESSDSVKSAISVLSQRYIISSNQIPQLMQFVSSKPSEEWSELSQPDVVAVIEGHLKTQGTGTYAAYTQQLAHTSRKMVGVSQYTPSAFKAVYSVRLTQDAEYALSLMDQASTHGDLTGYKEAKGMLAALLQDTSQDLLLRQETPRKAFGAQASEEDVAQAIKSANELIQSLVERSESIVEPEPKAKPVVNNDPFHSELYTHPLGGRADITSIQGGLDMLDGMDEDGLVGGLSGYEHQIGRNTLVSAKEEFPVLVKEYRAAMVEMDAASNDYDRAKSKAKVDKLARRINDLQDSVRKTMAALPNPF